MAPFASDKRAATQPLGQPQALLVVQMKERPALVGARRAHGRTRKARSTMAKVNETGDRGNADGLRAARTRRAGLPRRAGHPDPLPGRHGFDLVHALANIDAARAGLVLARRRYPHLTDRDVTRRRFNAVSTAGAAISRALIENEEEAMAPSTPGQRAVRGTAALFLAARGKAAAHRPRQELARGVCLILRAMDPVADRAGASGKIAVRQYEDHSSQRNFGAKAGAGGAKRKPAFDNSEIAKLLGINGAELDKKEELDALKANKAAALAAGKRREPIALQEQINEATDPERKYAKRQNGDPLFGSKVHDLLHPRTGAHLPAACEAIASHAQAAYVARTGESIETPGAMALYLASPEGLEAAAQIDRLCAAHEGGAAKRAKRAKRQRLAKQQRQRGGSLGNGETLVSRGAVRRDFTPTSPKAGSRFHGDHDDSRGGPAALHSSAGRAPRRSLGQL